MNKLFVILVILFSIPILSYGQGGAQIYAGLTAVSSNDKNIVKEGEGLYGYHVGLDARILSGTMFFSGGIQYHVIDLVSNPKKEFFKSDPKLTIIKTRFGLGFTPYEFTHETRLRAKVFGSFDFTGEYDSSHILNEEYKTLNGTFAGLVLGVGADIYFLTVDLEYEKGIVNMVRNIPGSKIDFWTFSVGFRF